MRRATLPGLLHAAVVVGFGLAGLASCSTGEDSAACSDVQSEEEARIPPGWARRFVDGDGCEVSYDRLRLMVPPRLQHCEPWPASLTMAPTPGDIFEDGNALVYLDGPNTVEVQEPTTHFAKLVDVPDSFERTDFVVEGRELWVDPLDQGTVYLAVNGVGDEWHQLDGMDCA